MSYITRIKTKTGDKQIDYKSLANLPKEIKIDNKLDVEGQAADSKAVGDALKTKQPIGDYMTPERMPSSLPNPYKIKFTGNAIAEYDGTSEVTVHIASEGEVIKTPVDSTLTNFGEAADAKVTGDKFSEVFDQLESIPDWAKTPDKPSYTFSEVGALSDTTTALPNPKKVIFTGSVNSEYDGSEEVTINIPEESVDISDKTVTFSIPDTYAEPLSGAKASNIFGNMIRWIKNAAESILTKNILVEKDTDDPVIVEAKNALHSVALHCSSAGNGGLYDRTHSKWLIRDDSSGKTIIGNGWESGTITLKNEWTENSTSTTCLMKNESLGLGYISVSLKGTLNANTHVIVASIPSGFRPIYSFYTEGTAGASGAIQVNIYNSGNIDVWGEKAGVDARFSAMYPLA